MSHSFADVWEAIADARPDAEAQVHDDRRYTWSQMDRRADGVAKALLDAGAKHQDKVAQYLYNGPEYLESLFGILKAGLAPVNTNYRYTDDELVYLWDNADAVAVAVPDEKFGEIVTAMVELEPGASLDEAGIITHVKSKLAAFKAPKHVLQVDTIGRAANAKVDYKRLKAEAIERLGVEA